MAATLKTTMSFSEEQALLLDTATEFFRDKSPTADVRARMTTEPGFDADHWQEMVALGWSGLAIPEEHGGTGLGLGAAVCIAEPMGRSLFASPWLPTQLFAQGVLAAGSDALQAQYLPAVAAGSVGTVALLEPAGSWVLADAATSFTEAGGRVLLEGSKVFVADAVAADFLLVSGRFGDEPALAALSGEHLGHALSRETVIDETRRCYQLTLDGLSVSVDQIVTGADAGRALDAIEQAAWLLLSAESAGGMAGVLDVIVEYLNTREAFGRKIGSYQALKHPSVDILIGLERARSHVYHAASVLDAGEEAEVALRMAKAESSDAFAFAGDRAIQFHGGFGFTWECDAQLYLRRALFNQYSFGDAAHHRKRLAALLL